MKYSIDVKPAAERYINKLSKDLQTRIIKKIRELEINPRSHGAIKLQGYKNTYRIRVGDYRILYEIHDDILLVLVVKVGHRSDVY